MFRDSCLKLDPKGRKRERDGESFFFHPFHYSFSSSPFLQVLCTSNNVVFCVFFYYVWVASQSVIGLKRHAPHTHTLDKDGRRGKTWRALRPYRQARYANHHPDDQHTNDKQTRGVNPKRRKRERCRTGLAQTGSAPHPPPGSHPRIEAEVVAATNRGSASRDTHD